MFLELELALSKGRVTATVALIVTPWCRGSVLATQDWQVDMQSTKITVGPKSRRTDNSQSQNDRTSADRSESLCVSRQQACRLEPEFQVVWCGSVAAERRRTVWQDSVARQCSSAWEFTMSVHLDTDSAYSYSVK